MVSGKSVMARMMVTTSTAGSVAALTKLQVRWTMLSAAAVQATKMMAFSIGHIAAVGGAFFAVTMMLKDYEAALVRAGAIGGLTTTQTAQLGAKLMQSASQYGASSTEMASGVLELTKAGFEFADVMASIDTITKVNIANNLDYTTSAEIATLVMKAFKVTVDDLEGHFDKLQFVVHKTLMDMGDFVELLRYAGSTAITAQVEPEKLYAMAGALADVAQQAGIGARGVNRMMIEMLKEVDAVQEWADSLGLGIDVIKDGVLNIDELIRGFSALGMTEEILLKSLEQFSIRSARAWLGLMINAEEYFDLVEGQKNAANYLNDVVGPQLETLERRLISLKESMLQAFRTPEFLSVTKKAFDQLEDSVMALMPALRELVLDLLVQAPQMFAMLIDVLAALLPILTNGILPVFKSMATVLDVLNRAGILKFIILMMLLKKLTPGIVASWNMIGAVMWKTKVTAQMLQASTGGFVASMILLWAISGRTKWAILAIAAALMAVAIAIVAVRTAGGDWTAALQVAMAVGSAVATGGLVLAMGSAVKGDASYSAKMLEQSSAEVDAAMTHQTGTRYVSRTGTALVHEGETVNTKTNNIFGNSRNGGTIIIENRGTIYGSEDALKELIRRVMAEDAEDAYT